MKSTIPISPQKKQLLQRLIEVESCAGLAKRYQIQIATAQKHFDKHNLEECSKILEQIPTADTLYQALLKTLRGKHLYRTLRQIDEGRPLAHYTKLKALTSLLTHIFIEIEKGNTEYELLVYQILDAVNVLAFSSTTSA